MSVSDEIGKLHELHERGALSDDEYARAKERVLNGSPAARAVDPAIHSLNALRRTRGDRMLGGVCGGLARATGLASWVVRLIFVLMLLCAGTGVLLYVLMWILVPEEDTYRIGSNGNVHPG